jgi:hypothetical protein
MLEVIGMVSTAPIVVLTYAYSGARRLQRLLDQAPDLACTAGTGVLAACSAAGDAWGRTEDRVGEPLSTLAKSSIRSMVSGMLATMTARAGRRRWCEICNAEASAAGVFLQAFPETKLVCMHRAFPDVAYAALRSNPWGAFGQQFVPFIGTYPGNMSAALAAWWAAQADALLAFEKYYPQSCLRVRYEDLFREPDSVAADVRDFLELGPVGPGDLDDPSGSHDWDIPGCGSDFPVGQLLPRLAMQVNTLHAELGYSELPSKREDHW